MASQLTLKSKDSGNHKDHSRTYSLNGTFDHFPFVIVQIGIFGFIFFGGGKVKSK